MCMHVLVLYAYPVVYDVPMYAYLLFHFILVYMMYMFTIFYYTSMHK